MRIAITPQENFFFRDARPFDKGEGWATGIFPPLPSTVYGALRSCAIAQSGFSFAQYADGLHNGLLKTEMGTPHALGNFMIRSLTLHDGLEALVPVPLDLRTRSKTNLACLVLNEQSDIVTDGFDCLYRPARREDDDIPESSWLSLFALKDYLFGKSVIKAVGIVQPICLEPKAGIEKGDTGTVKQGHLYFQEMQRLRDNKGKVFHLSVEAYNVTTLGDHGGLRMGHDGRLFSFNVDQNAVHFGFREELRTRFIQKMSENGKRFKILFTTPAVLRCGWRPAATDSHPAFTVRMDNGGSLTIKIESAAIGRPMRVGGWDLVARKPKPLYRAVPAGSVYYACLESGEPGTLFDTLFDRNLSDADSNLQQQGFGHILLGLPNN